MIARTPSESAAGADALQNLAAVRRHTIRAKRLGVREPSPAFGIVTVFSRCTVHGLRRRKNWALPVGSSCTLHSVGPTVGVLVTGNQVIAGSAVAASST